MERETILKIHNGEQLIMTFKDFANQIMLMEKAKCGNKSRM